eukprot:5346014-Amphidinium_carterae.2
MVKVSSAAGLGAEQSEAHVKPFPPLPQVLPELEVKGHHCVFGWGVVSGFGEARVRDVRV